MANFREQGRHALHDARQHEGLVYAQIGRQAHVDGTEEIVFVSVWRNLEVLYKWVGGLDLLETPVLDGNNPDVFEHFEVQHYETYGSPDPESAEDESLEDGASVATAAGREARG